MKTTLTLICVYLLVSTGVLGQSVARTVIASQGEESQNDYLSLEWTIGESFVESTGSTSMILTQGFHQYSLPLTEVRPQWSPLNLKRDNIDHVNEMQIQAFPNPFHSDLTVTLKGSYSDEQQYRLQFINSSGMVVHSTIIPDGDRQITFNQLNIPSGMYVITVQGSRDGIFGTNQIIKTD